MTETGTGVARARKVLRKRLAASFSEGEIWWPEDATFVPPAHTQPPSEPSSFLRVMPGPVFSQIASSQGSTKNQGTWSLLFACQSRPGMDAENERAETEVRALAHPSQNDNDEDVWTLGDVEIHSGIAPQVPESVRDGYYWTQFVIPYKMMEGFV